MPTNTRQLDATWAWSSWQPDANRPWNRALAAHLYRRAGFAANTGELNDAVKQGHAATIDRLFTPVTATAKTTAKDKGDEQSPADPAAFSDSMMMLGQSMMATGNPQSLSAWWLYRMTHTPDQLLEKTTLFWHGHFATSAAKVEDSKLMLRHNELLRRHALGRFEPFVQAMSRDAAMLLWLDAASNRKIRPNENYAREVMELFCLGVGNYTEKDIKEVARCFTGWEVNRGEFAFNKYQHDEGTKSFLGASGNFNGDDAVRVILKQPAAAMFIVRKLAKYFVAEEPALHDALLEPLAKELRDRDFEIAPVIRRMLSSNLFFSEHAIGRMVRPPVSLGVGLLRALEGKTNMTALAQGLQELGQAVFYPPNVKGWDGGRTWINASTLLTRANLVRGILRNNDSRFAGGKLSEVAAKYNATSAKAAVDWMLELLVAVPVPANVRAGLVEIADGNTGGGDLNERLTNTLQAIGTLPEFQLC